MDACHTFWTGGLGMGLDLKHEVGDTPLGTSGPLSDGCLLILNQSRMQKKNQLDGTEIISLEKNRPTHQAFSKGVSYKEFEKFRGAWVLDIELIERMMLVQMSCEGCIYGF